MCRLNIIRLICSQPLEALGFYCNIGVLYFNYFYSIFNKISFIARLINFIAQLHIENIYTREDMKINNVRGLHFIYLFRCILL